MTIPFAAFISPISLLTVTPFAAFTKTDSSLLLQLLLTLQKTTSKLASTFLLYWMIVSTFVSLHLISLDTILIG
jgi:hypothetical protein